MREHLGERGMAGPYRIPDLRLRSGDLVAAHIRELILAGRLKGGDRLPRNLIASELGVSRKPVRDAVVRLQAQGWVTGVEETGGTVISGLRETEVWVHYELRGIVLGLLAKRASEAAGPGDHAELRVLHQGVSDAESPEEFARANGRLLGLLTKLGATDRLRAVSHVPPLIPDGKFCNYVPQSIRVQRDGLPRVIRFIIDPRNGSADDAMRALLRQHGAGVLLSLSDAGLVQPRAWTATERQVPESSATKPRRIEETSTATVVRHVQQLVLRGHLVADQRVQPDVVGRQVGLSRTAVHEAILSLESHGWVRVEPHRGAYVNPWDERALADCFHLYGRYLSLAARIVVEQAGPDGVETLRGPAERLARLTRPLSVREASSAYCAALLQLAGSVRLSSAFDGIGAIVGAAAAPSPPLVIKTQKRMLTALNAAVFSRDRAAAEVAGDLLTAELGKLPA
jgi:DNA-binding GntR family transcriptional regulator